MLEPDPPESSPAAPAIPAETAHPGLLVVGWVVVGRLDPPDLEATRQARTRLLRYLEATLPRFQWRMPIITREAAQQHHEEPVALLEFGVNEREARRWDFALVVTGADLVARYKPFALGALSRGQASAVLSTLRIDPRADREEIPDPERIDHMARRLFALALHLFGHLAGLKHAAAPDRFMYEIQAVDDLDRMATLTPDEQECLIETLEAVADPRLEETDCARFSLTRFYLRAIRLNLGVIARAVRHMRPWLMPLRLTRLTTAALSTLLVLTLTAEAWDLGMSQPPARVAGLSGVALVGTSIFLMQRQGLLMRRRRAWPAEQTVAANVSVGVVVLLGMATTYLLLFGLSLTIGLIFFPAGVIEAWAGSLGAAVRIDHHLVLAAFVASMGLGIGALGASFEEQYYFRHVASVDEET